MYVAEGSPPTQSVHDSNTNQRVSIESKPLSPASGSRCTARRAPVTCSLEVASEFLGWLGTGGQAYTKRYPPIVFGWPMPLIAGVPRRHRRRRRAPRKADLGMDDIRRSCWGHPPVVRERLGTPRRPCRRDTAICRCARSTCPSGAQAPDVGSAARPPPRRSARRSRLDQEAESGGRIPERYGSQQHRARRGRDAVRVSTLRRLRDAYEPPVASRPVRAARSVDRRRSPVGCRRRGPRHRCRRADLRPRGATRRA